MLIPRWRLALTAGALVILGALGGGLVQAAVPMPDPIAATAPAAADATLDQLDDIILAADPSTAPGAVPDRTQKLRDRLAARLGGLRKRIVHGTVSLVGRDGKLVTVQLDHGTASAIGPGTITIAEAGGGSVPIKTTDATRVRVDKKLVSLSDLKVGDEVLVVSSLDGGTPTAKRIVVPPAAPATTPNG